MMLDATTPSRWLEREFTEVSRIGVDDPFENGYLTPAQKKGLQYEARVGRAIEEWCGSQDIREYWDSEWIEYDGKLAQPDKVVILDSGCALLFEVKLTWVDTTMQLGFYRALLNALGYDEVVAVTVCKNLCPGCPRDKIVRSLDDIYDGCIWQMRA